ncbi:hypothetical protein CCMSSC00406_0006151 [Pleurotus cornucopiae]|uniref:Uncharacterized protein n=1 Tax=Pleurotus cornucopiae TaxID=5321 RepID=A0ACB7J995_PLECO|nr:hypothetical protein CCMSSC00406_0006151 [Pleurotus cornucopiae]
MDSTDALNLLTPSSTSLPQYGFSDTIAFSRLFKKNPFLFRVYTPKERSPFADDTDPYFLAPKYNEAYSESPKNLSPVDSPTKSLLPAYAEVIRHLDWTTRSSSPFISTSFSFVWAIWEGLRRYHTNVKHDVHIAIINAEDVAHHAFTAAEILASARPAERHVKHRKWQQYCQESQMVLVYGSIPTTAVYNSVPLLDILEKLPSYFLHSENTPVYTAPFTTPLDRVAWNYTNRKLSYRQFCREMSARFQQLPFETRLRDTTAGSVRLAAAFVSPWFHGTIPVDFSESVRVLTKLALVISQWPGQWWSRDHYAEISHVVQAITVVLAEQVRDSLKSGTLDNTLESWTLEEIPEGMQPTTFEMSPKASAGQETISIAPTPSDAKLRESDSTDVPSVLESEEATDTIRPIIDKIAIQIPISAGIDDLATPRPPPSAIYNKTPTSLHDVLRAANILAHEKSYHTASDMDAQRSRRLSSSSITSSQHTLEESILSDSDTIACDDDEVIHNHHRKLSEDLSATSSMPLQLIDEDPESASEHGSDSEPEEEDSCIDSCPESEPAVAEVAEELVPSPSAEPIGETNADDWTVVSPVSAVPPDESAEETNKRTRGDGPSALETASYALTCFLIGSFITLCVLSPHRRALAHLT